MEITVTVVHDTQKISFTLNPNVHLEKVLYRLSIRLGKLVTALLSSKGPVKSTAGISQGDTLSVLLYGQAEEKQDVTELINRFLPIKLSHSNGGGVYAELVRVHKADDLVFYVRGEIGPEYPNIVLPVETFGEFVQKFLALKSTKKQVIDPRKITWVVLKDGKKMRFDNVFGDLSDRTRLERILSLAQPGQWHMETVEPMTNIECKYNGRKRSHD